MTQITLSTFAPELLLPWQGTKIPCQLDLVWLADQLKKRESALTSQDLRTYKRLSALHLPLRNRTLLHYDLLRRNTEKMDLDKDFRKRQIEVAGETFSVYDTGRRNFTFFIHAIKPWEPDVAQALAVRQANGILCLSLISDELPNFYNQETYYAAVLSVDPKAIVKTTPHDSYTPCDVRDPKTVPFYNAQYRLQILAAYIDELYREKIPRGFLSEDSMIRSLLSSQRTFPQEEVESFLYAQGIWMPSPPPNKWGETEKKLVELGFTPKNGLPNLPNLEHCLKSVSPEEISTLNPLIGPRDLLALTAAQPPTIDNKNGKTPYNEVNITFYDCPNAIQLKAILVDPQAIEANPANFLPVLLHAKAHNIPILLKAESIAESFTCLEEMAAKGDTKGIEELLLSTTCLTEWHIAEALSIAVEKRQYDTVRYLIENCPEIPSSKLKQAFSLLLQQFYCLTEREKALIFQAFPLSSFERLFLAYAESAESLKLIILFLINPDLPPPLIEKIVDRFSFALKNKNFYRFRINTKIENLLRSQIETLQRSLSSIPRPLYPLLVLHLARTECKALRVDLPKAIEIAETEGQTETAEDLRRFLSNSLLDSQRI